jgi:hypothetical protein
MHKEDHRVGITPIVMRRASYYLTLGLGEYFPEHPHFDKVLVEELYGLKQNPDDEMEWSIGIKVSFYQDGRCIRWVDFGCRTTGAGGDSILLRAHEPSEGELLPYQIITDDA